MKRKNRDRLRVLVISGLICLLCIATAVAYLTVADRKNNEFTVGDNRTEIIEEYQEPDELEPGMVISKKVSVKNTGKNDCYVRVLALYSDSSAEEYAEIRMNNQDWDLRDDGYYYYRYVLKAGEMTTQLFSEVKIEQDADKEQLKGFEIIVYAESINAETGGFS